MQSGVQSPDASSENGCEGNRGFSRVFNTLGFGSWGNLMRHLSMESTASASSNTASDKGKTLGLTSAALAARVSRVPSGYKKTIQPQATDGADEPVSVPIVEELVHKIEELLRDYSHGENGPEGT